MANPILKWFECDHLPPHLQAIVKPIREVADAMDGKLPPSPELSVGLRKLLEAKDALVRAAIDAKALETVQRGG